MCTVFVKGSPLFPWLTVCLVGLGKAEWGPESKPLTTSLVPLPASHAASPHHAPQSYLPSRDHKGLNSAQSRDVVPGSVDVEDRDEERKIGHLKIPRRALGSCAVLQLSGLPLQEDALKLGNEIVTVSGTHSQKGHKGVLKSSNCSSMLGAQGLGMCLLTFPSACEGHCVLSKNKGAFQLKTLPAKH